MEKGEIEKIGKENSVRNNADTAVNLHVNVADAVNYSYIKVGIP